MWNLSRRAASARAAIAIEPVEPRAYLAVDFVVNSWAAAPTFVYPGDFLGRLVGDFTLIVQNAGSTSSSGIVFVDVIYSTDAVIGNGDDVVDEQALDFGAVAAGNATVIDDQGSVAPEELNAGQYYLGVRIDPTDDVAEANESNNTAVTSSPVITVIEEAWAGGTDILGTEESDVIHIVQPNGIVFVTVNGVTRAVDEAEPDEVFIDALAGNDLVIADGAMETRVRLTGSGGDDTIQGGAGHDELSGANGKDRVLGGGGDDYLLGGASRDYLNGEDGDDTMSGAGGGDRIYGVLGRDSLIGGGGNDLLFARDIDGFQDDPDAVSGGLGFDRAQTDGDDDQTPAGIEEVLP